MMIFLGDIIKEPFFIINFLTGILFVLVAIVQLKFPPKRINSFYGYRTRSSMKSIEAWNFAQKYSSKIMLFAGAFLCFLSFLGIKFSLKELEYEIVLAISFLCLVIAIMIYLVEKELKKRF